MNHVQFVSFHELGAKMLWIKEGPGQQTGGPPPRANLAITCHLEKNASHNFINGLRCATPVFVGTGRTSSVLWWHRCIGLFMAK